MLGTFFSLFLVLAALCMCTCTQHTYIHGYNITSPHSRWRVCVIHEGRRVYAFIKSEGAVIQNFFLAMGEGDILVPVYVYEHIGV